MALNTLQGYNSNSPRRTSLQRVFVRPKHLYTRRPLSLPRTVSPLHVRSSHMSQRTFDTETAQDLAPVASCLSGHLAWAEVLSTRGASGSSKPSAPKHNCPCFWHRRPAPLRWAAPAQQNSHNSSSISVAIKPPLQKLPRVAEAALEPKPSA
jgi:hypothetical protein